MTVDAVDAADAADAADAPGAGDAAVGVEHLRHRYGDALALDDVTLAVPAGEVLALVGPSGCGKTTLLRAIAGHVVPDSGTIRLGGRVVTHDGRLAVPPEARRVGLVVQDLALFPHLDVVRNVAFGLRGRSRAARRARVGELLELTRLAGRERAFPHELSGGEQQRVALARALAPEPEVVLLDEPFASLDPSLRSDVRSEIVGLLRAAGATVVVVTHDRDEALAIGDRVAVLTGGRLHQVAPPVELFTRPADAVVAALMGAGAIVPATPDGARLRTPLGVLTPDRGAPAVGEGRLAVVVGPHQLEVHPAAGARDGVAGVARHVQFLGRRLVVVVALADGTEVEVDAPPSAPFAPGDAVHVRLRTDEEVVVLAGGRRVDVARSPGGARSPHRRGADAEAEPEPAAQVTPATPG